MDDASPIRAGVRGAVQGSDMADRGATLQGVRLTRRDRRPVMLAVAGDARAMRSCCTIARIPIGAELRRYVATCSRTVAAVPGEAGRP